MVESAHDYAIISTDLEGIIISWNTGAESVFGFTPEEVIGNPISTIFTPEDRAHGVRAYEMRVAAEKGRARDERWHLRKNGERFYASGIMAVMHDDHQRVKGFIKIARDMTQEQQAQEDLIAARNAAEAANIAKTEFLANMSHEIRTPMNAVIGLANILALSKPLSERQQEFIKTLQMSADSLLALINDLLDIAKIEAQTVELEQLPLNVALIVEEVANMMAVRVREKGLAFSENYDSMTHRIYMGDPWRLRQIIMNLCSNAIKFTEKGTVHVAIDYRQAAAENTDDIIITVTDTGIGIAPEKLENIFHKFVQADTSINRKYGGTGLGLAITKTLTEIMGGAITVRSVPAQGSVFEVIIPMKRATELEIEQAQLSLPAIFGSALSVPAKSHVLLVEDYAPNVLVASTFIEQFGYSVDVASNGLEACEMVKKNHYALALMDVQMPSLNGFESTQRIREHEKTNNLPRLPIIGMTAHALAGDRERCLAAGMDDYISKPFNPTELQDKMKSAIHPA
jgi:PAS domain S-box-containing protein